MKIPRVPEPDEAARLGLIATRALAECCFQCRQLLRDQLLEEEFRQDNAGAS